MAAPACVQAFAPDSLKLIRTMAIMIVMGFACRVGITAVSLMMQGLLGIG